MENINKQFEQLYTLLELTDFQADLIKKLQNDVNTALRQPLVSGSLPFDGVSEGVSEGVKRQ